MHESVAPLKHTFDLNTRLFLNCLDGLDDEEARKRPTESTNHAAFVALHLVDVRHFLARGVGLESKSPFESLTKDAKRLEDVEEYPSLEAIRSAWTEVSERLSGRLESLTGDELAGGAPAKFPIEGGDTLLGTVTFLVHHDGYHVGQLSLLRRCVGKDAMSYR